MKTPIRRNTKKWHKFNSHYHTLLEQGLLDLGAVKTVDKWHSYYIETKYGELGITPVDGWIATSFSDPKRAYEGMRLSYYPAVNMHTGKWNFHGEDAQESLEWFLSCLKEIV